MCWNVFEVAQASPLESPPFWCGVDQMEPWPHSHVYGDCVASFPSSLSSSGPSRSSTVGPCGPPLFGPPLLGPVGPPLIVPPLLGRSVGVIWPNLRGGPPASSYSSSPPLGLVAALPLFGPFGVGPLFHWWLPFWRWMFWRRGTVQLFEGLFDVLTPVMVARPSYG